MKRRSWIAAALIVVAIALFAVWSTRQRAEQAELQLGLDSARVLGAVFEKTSALQVSRLSGTVVARSKAESGLGLIENEQLTRAPFAVLYTLDLRQLSPSDYHWNADTRTMVVDIPEVIVGAPAVDMAKAQVRQKGIYISRKSGLAMQQQAASRLGARAKVEAHRPENLAKARAAAREAVTDFVRGPLAAANRGDIRVVVRLPGEPRPPTLSREQWEVSRSIEEVLGAEKAR